MYNMMLLLGEEEIGVNAGGGYGSLSDGMVAHDFGLKQIFDGIIWAEGAGYVGLFSSTRLCQLVDRQTDAPLYILRNTLKA